MSRLRLPHLAASGILAAAFVPPQEPVAVGRIDDVAIREASGLARSRRGDDVLWVLNDKGAGARLHAMDSRGARLGEFDLADGRNVDWEDLASFELDGTPYLLIADIGDNDAERASCTLHVVEEPGVEPGIEAAGAARSAWRIDFRYPDGPRDAESVAVDMKNGRVLILTKRDSPPVLYALPLRPESEGTVVATKLGPVTSLPAPRKGAEVKDWRPVGMDVSEDGLAAVVLTYAAVHCYERKPDQDWLEALNAEPRRVAIPTLEKAEAIAFGGDARRVLVTGEGVNVPILAVDFAAPAKK